MNETQHLSVSVVLPAKNEEGGIGPLVMQLRPLCDEVIVVDGRSTDRTAEIASAAGARVIDDGGRGKGAGYAVGLAAAHTQIVVFMDADGSHHPGEIPQLIAPIISGEADLVIGSRHRGGSDEWEGDVHTWLRAMGSGFLSVTMNARWGTSLTDVLNGFRATRREVAVTVPLLARDFDVEQHMIAQFLKRGHRVVEVRSHEYRRQWGTSKLPTYRRAYIFFRRLFLDLVF